VRRYAAALTALILAAPAQRLSAKDQALLSLTLEHFRDSASVRDDPVRGVTTISTEPGFVQRGLFGMVWSDEFTEAVIDDRSGRKSFEVDVSVTYSGAWRSYESAIYEAGTGSMSVPPTLIKKETANCALAECTYTEHLAFPIEEALLRQLASTYAPGKPTLWNFKLIGKRVPDYRGGLSTAEIAGLLARVDAYTAGARAHGASAEPPAIGATSLAAAPPILTPAPRRPDFGINGMAVSAAPDMPQRAGLLVVGVTSGSPAQKAGIIVGDIIFKVDERAIQSLADLEAAVAANAGSPAAVIKVYRGTDAIALTARF